MKTWSYCDLSGKLLRFAIPGQSFFYFYFSRCQPGRLYADDDRSCTYSAILSALEHSIYIRAIKGLKMKHPTSVFPATQLRLSLSDLKNTKKSQNQPTCCCPVFCQMAMSAPLCLKASAHLVLAGFDLSTPSD